MDCNMNAEEARKIAEEMRPVVELEKQERDRLYQEQAEKEKAAEIERFEAKVTEHYDKLMAEVEKVAKCAGRRVVAKILDSSDKNLVARLREKLTENGFGFKTETSTFEVPVKWSNEEIPIPEEYAKKTILIQTITW